MAKYKLKDLFTTAEHKTILSAHKEDGKAADRYKPTLR